MLGDSPRLILVAKQEIEEGKELLYDYEDRLIFHDYFAA